VSNLTALKCRGGKPRIFEKQEKTCKGRSFTPFPNRRDTQRAFIAGIGSCSAMTRRFK
jgi:hypothetical protein